MMEMVGKILQFQMFCAPVSQPVPQPVRKFLSFLFLLSLIFLMACDSTQVGRVTDQAGNPVVGTAVRLIVIDDKGTETSALTSAITDERGEFQLSSGSTANGSIIVTVDLTEGTLRGFVAGKSSAIDKRVTIPIHPLTEAFLSLVLDITSPSGGRSLSDFLSGELKDIAETIFKSDTTSLDLSDAASLKTFLRTLVGRKIALAAGGQISSQSTSALEGNETSTSALFTQDNSICITNAPFHLLSSTEFRFDFQRDGSICGGNSTTLFRMLVDGALFTLIDREFFQQSAGFPSSATATLEGGRELTLEAAKLEKVSMNFLDPPEEDTISVQRKMYVPESGDFARYLEIFTNTGSEQTISFKIDTTLDTAAESALLTNDLSPATPSTSDRYVVAYDVDQTRPTAGFLFQDGLGSVSVSDLNSPGGAGTQVDHVIVTWSSVALPANSTKTFVHYILLSSSFSASDLQTSMLDLVNNPDMTGMSQQELANLQNFLPNRGTANGEAGSVIGLAQVTATNQRTSDSLTVSARKDGSFSIPISSESGDSLKVTASDGLDTTIIVP